MLIEHSFVTTLEAPRVLGAAGSFLREIGFVPEFAAAPDSEACLHSLQMSRGNGRGRDPKRSRQTVRLEFDRGRVTVAASIVPVVPRRNFTLTLSRASAASASSNDGRPYADLMIALVSALESLLARGQSPKEATQAWTGIEETVTQKWRSARVAAMTRSALVLLCLFFVVICLIGLASK